MQELKNINEALEYVRMQTLDYFGNLNVNDSPAEIAQKNSKEDLLFFPRKKLRMQKLRSGNWKPRAWFIQDRLEERATALEQPTHISNEGITSGLRSAIIMEPNGKYLRLKGVAPKTFEAQRQFIGPATKNPTRARSRRGLSDDTEAYNELTWVTQLNKVGFDFVSMRPEYVEFFLPPFKQNEAKDFLKNYNRRRAGLDHINLVSQKSSERMNILEGFSDLADRGYYGRKPAFVSAFRISSDTRLDEAIYELTRTELTGDKKFERDDLVHYLAHNAGQALAFLNASGLVWSAKLYNTNSHIGNFVLGRSNGRMQVEMCDFSALTSKPEFGRGKDIVDRKQRGSTFWEHATREMELFRDDFFSEYTMSHPTNLRFRHFSPELRESSYQVFQTGYATVTSFINGLGAIMPSVAKPDKIVVPKETIMSEMDFRQKVDYIMSA